MKASNKILTSVMALPLLLGSVTAFAHGNKIEKLDDHHLMRFIFKSVDLTDEQKNQLFEIKKQKHQEDKAKHKESRANAKETYTQYKDLVLANNFDEGAVRALAEKMATEQTEKRIKQARFYNETFNILTDEQKTQVQANLADMKQKMKERKESRSNQKNATIQE